MGTRDKRQAKEKKCFIDTQHTFGFAFAFVVEFAYMEYVYA